MSKHIFIGFFFAFVISQNVEGGNLCVHPETVYVEEPSKGRTRTRTASSVEFEADEEVVVISPLISNMLSIRTRLLKELSSWTIKQIMDLDELTSPQRLYGRFLRKQAKRTISEFRDSLDYLLKPTSSLPSGLVDVI